MRWRYDDVVMMYVKLIVNERRIAESSEGGQSGEEGARGYGGKERLKIDRDLSFE